MVKVLQCDRDAAAALVALGIHDGKDMLVVERIKSGQSDEEPLVQAFASYRHRLTAQSERVVEVLKDHLLHLEANPPRSVDPAHTEDYKRGLADSHRLIVAGFTALLSSLDGKES